MLAINYLSGPYQSRCFVQGEESRPDMSDSCAVAPKGTKYVLQTASSPRLTVLHNRCTTGLPPAVQTRLELIAIHHYAIPSTMEMSPSLCALNTHHFASKEQMYQEDRSQTIG